MTDFIIDKNGNLVSLDEIESQNSMDSSNRLAKGLTQQAFRGATANLSDPIYAGIKSLSPNVTYQEARQGLRELNKYTKETAPKAAMAANIGGSAIGFGKLNALKVLPSQLAKRATLRGRDKDTIKRALEKASLNAKGVAGDSVAYSVASDIVDDKDAELVARNAALSGLLGAGSAKLIGGVGKGLVSNANRRKIKKDNITSESILKKSEKHYKDAAKHNTPLDDSIVDDAIRNASSNKDVQYATGETKAFIDALRNKVNVEPQLINNKSVRIQTTNSLQKLITDAKARLPGLMKDQEAQAKAILDIIDSLDDTLINKVGGNAQKSHAAYLLGNQEYSRYSRIANSEKVIGNPNATDIAGNPIRGKIEYLRGADAIQEIRDTARNVASGSSGVGKNSVANIPVLNVADDLMYPSTSQKLKEVVAGTSLTDGNLNVAGGLGVLSGIATGGIAGPIAILTGAEAASRSAKKQAVKQLQEIINALKLQQNYRLLSPSETNTMRTISRVLGAQSSNLYD